MEIEKAYRSNERKTDSVSFFVLRFAVNGMTQKQHHNIEDVNWGARSLFAAAGVAVCLLLSAFSATITVENAAAARMTEQAVADEAELFAEFAAYLAKDTEAARVSLDRPRLKPAPSTRQSNLDIASADHDLVDFDFNRLEKSALDAAEWKCLSQAIYYEARNEPRVGQLGVADVVLNRVKSSVYPNSICGVVFQGSERKTGCQFSFTCDGSMKARLNTKAWTRSEDLAGAVLAGMRLPISGHATHYHADYVSPPWAKRLTPTAEIGRHRFYRFPSRRRVANASSD